MASQKAEEETVLIIGAGVFGSSTAYHLSKQYQDASKITVIDRTPAPPEPAASTDINKIIRADYSSAFYAELAYEAMDAWTTWPELKDFYHRTGWIMLNEEGSDVAERIRQVFKNRGHDPTSDVPLKDVERHWKGILRGTDLQGFDSAYWNPEAGWCDAASATASVMNAAISRGVKYIVDDVDELLFNGSKITGVRTTSGQNWTGFSKVLLATGAWTSHLLSPIEDVLQLPESDRIEQQVTAAGVAVAHYRMSSTEMSELSEMPVVVYGEHGEVIPPPLNNHLLKYTNANTFTNYITTSSGRKISVPPSRGSRYADQRIVPEILKQEMVQNMFSKVMTKFSQAQRGDGPREPEYWRICWDSITPTQDWLLTRHPHPRLSNLYLAVGGSFHSYKFLPIVGKYMINVLNGKGNGSEKDNKWGWKDSKELRRGGGAHQSTLPKRDLGDIVGEQERIHGGSRL